MPGVNGEGGPAPDGQAERLLAEENAYLREQVRRLRRRVADYEELARTIERAETWDYTLYDQLPDDRWVAIDRRDLWAVLQRLASVDRWAPWRGRLEARAQEPTSGTQG